MPYIALELTNRCNLNCQHCFDGRHGGDGDLKINIIENVLRDCGSHGFDFISITGGEPTLHIHFIEIIKLVYKAGYKFGFVSNGFNFAEIYKKLLPYQDKLTMITFSLDGASEETHDRNRGKGSFRRVMQAVSICMVKNIPFTFNTAITSYNRNQLKEVAEFAQQLGSPRQGFGHLIPTPLNTAEKMSLSFEERREAEATIRRLQKDNQLPVVMAPGFYTDDLFPCPALKMKEFNIDWRGNVTMCCHLSGHGENLGNGDMIGNLDAMSFSKAYEHLNKFKKKFRENKLEHHNKGKLRDSDYFPCWYCSNYFDKVDWMKDYPQNSWSRLVWDKKIE